MTGSWRDLRLAVRELRKSPGYTAAALLTLSLAMAANTAVFGAVYAVLLGPDPIDRPGELVIAWDADPEHRQPTGEVTYRNFLEWAKSPFFRSTAAMGSSHWPMVLDGRTTPVRLAVQAVSDSFFRTLGTQPALGRAFTRDDDSETAGRVAILSHSTWVTHFGADPGIIGRTVTLEKPTTIVGVMPEGFDFPRGTDLWTPVVPILTDSSAAWGTDVRENVRVLHVIGRTVPGATIEAVRDDFDRIAGTLEGADREPRVSVVTPFLDHVLGPVRTGLWWLLGSVAVLLFVAAANLAGLSLTRAATRRRDDAVRLALGATTALLSRRSVLEAAVLAAASAGLGLLASTWVMEAIKALAPDDIPRIASMRLSAPAVGFTLCLACLVAVLCGIAPLLAARSTGIGEALSAGAHTIVWQGSRRLRAALGIAQVSLALVTLIVAGLILRSFTNLRQLDLGFEPQQVLTMHVQPRSVPNPAGEWWDDVTERLQALPGVESAGAAFLRPLAYGAVGTDMTVLLREQPETVETALGNPRVNYQTVTRDYFRAMRIPVLAGRAFDGRDRLDTARAVIVSQSTADALWPGSNPIGRRLTIPSRLRSTQEIVWQTVVGVVKDVHYRGVGDVRLDVYEAAAQSDKVPEFVVVRTSTPPLSLVAGVQRVVRDVNGTAVFAGATTLETVIDRELAPWRLTSWILSLCAVFALLLTLVGLVAHLWLELAQRSREFALRLAVGAESRQLRWHVLGGTARRTSAGILAGLLVSAQVTQLMRAMLFGVGPADLATWGTVTAGTFAIALTTSYVVTRRVVHINPIVALRAE